MSIIQFIRILWAHRMLPVLTTTATLIGAVIAILIIPPSYQAKTRVMLNILKPDPVTGEMIGGNYGGRTYLATQMELIKDVGVAGLAVDQLRPAQQSQDHRQPIQWPEGGPDNDLRRAMAQQIVNRTNVEVVTGTNMLGRSALRAATPRWRARDGCNELRDAFVESTLSGRRRDAARNADWFTQQATKERDLLSKADAVKTDFEREAGIVMQDEKTDVETAAGLRALSMQGPAVIRSGDARALRRAELRHDPPAGATRQPDRPGRKDPRAEPSPDDPAARPTRLPAEGGARCQRGVSGGPGQRGRRRRAPHQRKRKPGRRCSCRKQLTSLLDRDKIEHPESNFRPTVNLHRDQMEKVLAICAGEFNKEAAVADSGISIVNEAITPREPSFPKKPLILGGALGLGLVL